ncbi:MAG: rod shape-determining protein MreC [Prevotella sp.]|nr:rod shape-determining protein MreC [Prevotella sp.]
MQNLIVFFTKNFHWLLFLFLELVCVVLLFRYNSYQGSVWVSSANAVVGKVYEWQSSVGQFFSLEERARQLTDENIALQQQLSHVRQELLDLKGDSALADSMMQDVIGELHLLPAKVVSNSLRRPDNLLTIDRGRADGVLPDMGVVSGTGLVGVVYMAGEHYSVVMPLLNVHSRVSCAIRNHGYFGYMSWDGSSATDAFMEDVPRHAQFDTGEWVETSGYSDIFPPGITIGQITAIGNSADGLSYRLRVKLNTDFSTLREVSIITDDTFPERLQLLKAARDSMAVAN